LGKQVNSNKKVHPRNNYKQKGASMGCCGQGPFVARDTDDKVDDKSGSSKTHNRHMMIIFGVLAAVILVVLAVKMYKVSTKRKMYKGGLQHQFANSNLKS